MSDARREDGGRLQRLADVPLVGGFVGGLVSFLGGYIGFLALLTGTGEAPWQIGVVSALRSIAQAFYNAFNVPTYQRQRLTIEGANGTRETITEVWQNSVTGFRTVTRRQVVNGQTVDQQSQSGAIETALAAPDLVYLLVPVLAILVVGVVVGYRVVDLASDDPNEIALQAVGGAVAMSAGFLVLSLGLTFVLVRTGQNAVLHPSRLDAIIYGIAYPLVGGIASIALGAVFQIRQDGASSGATAAVETTSEASAERANEERAETEQTGEEWADEERADDEQTGEERTNG